MRFVSWRELTKLAVEPVLSSLVPALVMILPVTTLRAFEVYIWGVSGKWNTHTDSDCILPRCKLCIWKDTITPALCCTTSKIMTPNQNIVGSIFCANEKWNPAFIKRKWIQKELHGQTTNTQQEIVTDEKKMRHENVITSDGVGTEIKKGSTTFRGNNHGCNLTSSRIVSLTVT